LRRIPVNVAADDLTAALRQCCDAAVSTLVVIEGVLMYLDKASVKELLRQLQDAFPVHTLMCELLDRTFVNRYMHKSTREETAALGTPFVWVEDRPEQLFLSSGYKHCGEPISIVGRTRDLRAISIPGFLFATVLRSMRDGYRVQTFEFS
jgi:hypothetical protein